MNMNLLGNGWPLQLLRGFNWRIDVVVELLFRVDQHAGDYGAPKVSMLSHNVWLVCTLKTWENWEHTYHSGRGKGRGRTPNIAKAQNVGLLNGEACRFQQLRCDSGDLSHQSRVARGQTSDEGTDVFGT